MRAHLCCIKRTLKDVDACMADENAVGLWTSRTIGGTAISNHILKRQRGRSGGGLGRAGAFLKRVLGRHPVPPNGDPGSSLADLDRFVAPNEGRWITEVFVNFAGMRTYRLYIPSAYRGQPLPLIVMLHGCRQWPEDFAAGTQMNFVAEKSSCFVAYPGQPKSANGLRCWNWFNPRHQHRGRGEPSLIAGLTRRIVNSYAIDPARIYVAGLSAGGAAAAIMAATYPDLYAAAGIHSGLARGSARNVPSAYAVMRNGQAEIAPEVAAPPISLIRQRPVPMIVFHGDRDDTVHPRNSDRVLEQAWPGAGSLLRRKQTRGRVKGGHGYSRTSYADERGRSVLEMWEVHDSGHAWSGGHPAGSFTDPKGPDASREMMRFFLAHRLEGAVVAEDAAP